MTSAVNRLQDGTIELTITIPWEDVVRAREKALASVASQAKVPGFRKGKAPKKLVSDQVDPQKLHEEVLKELLPKAVSETIKSHQIEPILTPEIHAVEMSDDKDWQFIAKTCELPVIDLGDYKEEVKKVTVKSKIIVPGKEPFGIAQGKPETPKLDDIVAALLASSRINVPKILIDHEVDRLLSQLLTEVKSLGLTLERYLTSTGKTAQLMRDEYEKRAEDDIRLELILQKIAEEEKITVNEKDLEESLAKIKDGKEKEAAADNKYLLARLIRQQKTLDLLTKL